MNKTLVFFVSVVLIHQILCGGCSPNDLGETIEQNEHKNNDQIKPSSSYLKDNLAIVVWQSNLQDGSGYGVYGQLVKTKAENDEEIQFVGSEFAVNTYTVSDQTDADVSGYIYGSRFAIVWGNEWNEGGTCCSIRAQVFKTDGSSTPAAIGGEKTISASNSKNAKVTNLPGSELFVVAYQRFESPNTNIYAVIYNASGTNNDDEPVEVTSEFKVSGATADDKTNPDVLGLLDNKFVFFWENHVSENQHKISMQIYKWSGEGTISTFKVGGQITVSSSDDGDQTLPSSVHVDFYNQGKFPNFTYFAIAWQSSGSASETDGIYFKWCQYDYEKENENEQVNWITPTELMASQSTVGQQRFPAVEHVQTDEKDMLSFVWQGQHNVTVYDENNNVTYEIQTDVRASFFDITGQDTEPTRLGSDATISQKNIFGDSVPQISALTTDRFLVTWQDVFIDSSGYGIASQLMSSNKAPTVINPIEDQEADYGAYFEYIFPSDSFSDDDPNSNPLEYTANEKGETELPDWLSFAGSQRNFSGNAPEVCQTEFEIEVHAKDECDGEVIDTFVLTVVNLAPKLEKDVANKEVTVGNDFEYVFSEDCFKDPELGALTYSKSSPDPDTELPSWLLFEQENRKFYGNVPIQCPETFNVTLSAKDQCDSSTSTIFSISIERYPPYVDEGIEDQIALGTELFEFQFDDDCFGDSHDSELTYSSMLSDGEDLPDWLNFDSTKRKYIGTAPNSNQDLDIKVTAQNECDQSITQYFTIKVRKSDVNPSSHLKLFCSLFIFSLITVFIHF
ncbi:dystroglycan-related [Anaeramoeba flamelloides]|uniref:Dystroglycan-related n=1 Tax=Anaeramoeba flamelloides TaxID=1746091 RepID=A0AAV7ZJM1_9EUKA|nr:dystroglycan-related [Anaeramoeba flamelloides]